MRSGLEALYDKNKNIFIWMTCTFPDFNPQNISRLNCARELIWTPHSSRVLKTYILVSTRQIFNHKGSPESKTKECESF